MQREWNLPHGRLLVLALGLFLFVYLVLALTEIGSGTGCHWAFPRWFGCVLGLHETLAAGLIGAGGALIAAWMAWTAVQQQINAERERMVADRKEAERLLAEDLTNYADGMAIAWRELVAVPNPRLSHRLGRAFDRPQRTWRSDLVDLITSLITEPWPKSWPGIGAGSTLR